jgi:hypothetical protein
MYMADNKSREIGQLTVKVDVDISEALTGLKALQREAKKAAQALRELEEAKEPAVINIAIKNYDGKADANKLAKAIEDGLKSRGVRL